VTSYIVHGDRVLENGRWLEISYQITAKESTSYIYTVAVKVCVVKRLTSLMQFR